MSAKVGNFGVGENWVNMNESNYGRDNTPKRRQIWEGKIAKGLVVSSLAIFVVVPLGLEPRTP